MILATDSFYGKDFVRTASVIFRNWSDAKPSAAHVITTTDSAARYAPGSFYLRELPFILSLLEAIPERPSTVVIDGYVYLDAKKRKGLGAHLFEAINERAAVVGVAKRPFAGSAHAKAVFRGGSKNPLYVTAAGMPVSKAAQAIQSMNGPHRHPSLLKLCDRLSRNDVKSCNHRVILATV